MATAAFYTGNRRIVGINAGGMAAAAAALAILLIALVGAVDAAGEPPFSCGASSAEAAQGYAFCDASQPAARRAADLVSRLTAAEKAAQLGDVAPGVPRLGVPAYKWWNEALHGLATSGKGLHFDGAVRAATSFPQVLLTAAAFDDDLWFRIGQAIGREARALYNVGQAEGLTIWSPNVNIFRDPRWGRGQETPGEDPAVASRYAVAFVRGLQGSPSLAGAPAPPSPLQASACCKHATAYDLEDWNGVARYSFNARVTAQDLADTFNPPFRSCVVDAGASCVMCAYTEINGVPACANAGLLTDTVRGDWGLDGYIASDCDAVAIMRDAQRYTPTPEDAVSASLKAGLDIDCGSYVQQHATAAIQQGKLTEQDLDKALTNLFAVRMRLGHFDGDPRASTAPYAALGAGDICTPEHRALVLEAAQDGIVLLKNDAGLLPLNRAAVASAAVIGPNANDGLALIANYFGPPCESTTPLKGIQSYVADVRFVAGCTNSAACDAAATDQAVAAASGADYTFLFMGLSQKQESEGRDRTSLLLPGQQQSLITAVADASKHPVILVLLSGGPVDVTFAQTNPKIGAILWAGYPGQAGGLAVARVLFGDHNPGGRLPVTWYPEEFTTVPMTDMRMRADPATGYPGRSYRFYNGRTVYKFGYGLSYSTVSRRIVSGSGNKPSPPNANVVLAGLRETVAEDGGASYYHVDDIGADGCEQLKFPAVVEVQNHGPMDGKHSVLMFLRWPNATAGRPASQLVGFRKQHLKAGEKAHLKFDVSPCEHLSRVREDGKKVIDKGSHFLMVDDHEMEIRNAGGMAAAVLLLLMIPALFNNGAAGAGPPISCGPSSPAKAFPFCNKKLPAAQRAADLVSRMTAAEKVAQLGDIAAGVPRLDVPSYKWWNEALHGVAISGKGIHLVNGGAVHAATSFPQVLLTAASFNDNLWFLIGQATGRRLGRCTTSAKRRADNVVPEREHLPGPAVGPGSGDPRRGPGRGEPVRRRLRAGLQGNAGSAKAAPPPVLQTSACCKHATAYDLEDWKGVSRYSFVAKVTAQDLADTFNPPFRSCVVDGGASCVMCAYTSVNGVPSCANSDLLTKTFRGSWGLDGYVAADCDAVAIMRNSQFYRPTAEETVAVSLKAGLDIDCGTYVQQFATSALQKGKLMQQDVDKAVKNLFAIRMRLGHFDGDPKANTYGALGASHICTPEHKSLALEAALDGIVLLKNAAGALPLHKASVASAAVIGPNANDVLALLGNYWGPPCEPTTPLAGIQGYVRNARFLAGCSNGAACAGAATDQAVALAKSVDTVIMFMGLSQTQESEGRDRTTLLLPGQQQNLITAVANAAKKPVILVLLTGGPVDITFAQANPKIGAILWAGYPGQAGGLAIAKVLFSDKNPSGKLPVTWYPEEFTKFPMTDMRMRADPASGYPGRSYRFYNGKTVYKFGYGLSYSKFSHRIVARARNPASNTSLLAGVAPLSEDKASYHIDKIGTDVCDQLRFPAVVKVQNHGPVDGKHSVLMFLRWPNATAGRPVSQLIGFRNEHLKVGEKANLRFDISPCEHFSRVREDGRKVIDKGSHFLRVEEHELEIRFEA
ncbi:hypothetical protein EJB05_28271, partial [Eragrostis curvula]